MTLASTTDLGQPKITTDVFENCLDLVAPCQGVCFVDDILMRNEGMEAIIGENLTGTMSHQSNKTTEIMVKEGSQTGFHPNGTIRMSQDVHQAAVDNKLKVFDVGQLRVIDPSVIPIILDCRAQNAVHMIQEKVGLPKMDI